MQNMGNDESVSDIHDVFLFCGRNSDPKNRYITANLIYSAIAQINVLKFSLNRIFRTLKNIH